VRPHRRLAADQAAGGGCAITSPTCGARNRRDEDCRRNARPNSTDWRVRLRHSNAAGSANLGTIDMESKTLSRRPSAGAPRSPLECEGTFPPLTRSGAQRPIGPRVERGRRDRPVAPWRFCGVGVSMQRRVEAFVSWQARSASPASSNPSQPAGEPLEVPGIDAVSERAVLSVDAWSPRGGGRETTEAKRWAGMPRGTRMRSGKRDDHGGNRNYTSRRPTLESPLHRRRA